MLLLAKLGAEASFLFTILNKKEARTEDKRYNYYKNKKQKQNKTKQNIIIKTLYLIL